MKLQIGEAQLSDSDSSTDNKSDRSHHTNRNVLKKKYSEVRLKKSYKAEFAFVLSFIANKEIN
jgi:hypothetical protein